MQNFVWKKGTLPCLSRSVLLILVFLSLPDLIRAETRFNRFFLMGDGKIQIRNTHTGKEVRVSLLNPDGSLNEEGLAGIDEVFGFPGDRKGGGVSQRLIFMLDYFSDLVAPGKRINLESGYRSPQYNSRIRNAGGNVARTSTHIDGMALDFNIEGVNGKELWEIIRSRNCCGIGHYGGKNVHLDSARPRFWEASTSKVRTGESDHNRRIYLSTDYDRYGAGDTVRLSFTSVSDFGFGIRSTVFFVDGPQGDSKVAVAVIRTEDESDCVMIRDRLAAQSVYFSLPRNLEEGRYRVMIDFCRRPFEEMPPGTVSNEIELIGHAP